MRALLVTSIVEDDKEFRFNSPIAILEETGLMFSKGCIFFVDAGKTEQEKHGISDEEADKLAQSLLKRRDGSSRILPS